MMRFVCIALALAAVAFAQKDHHYTEAQDAPKPNYSANKPSYEEPVKKPSYGEPENLNKPFESEKASESAQAHSLFSGLGEDEVLKQFLDHMNLDRIKEMNNPEVTEHFGVLQDMMKGKDLFKSVPEALKVLKSNPALKDAFLNDAKSHEDILTKFADMDFQKIFQNLFGGMDVDNLFGGLGKGGEDDFLESLMKMFSGGAEHGEL